MMCVAIEVGALSGEVRYWIFGCFGCMKLGVKISMFVCKSAKESAHFVTLSFILFLNNYIPVVPMSVVNRPIGHEEEGERKKKEEVGKVERGKRRRRQTDGQTNRQSFYMSHGRQFLYESQEKTSLRSVLIKL